MGRALVWLTALLVVAAPVAGSAAPRGARPPAVPCPDGTVPLFAGGGTNVSNGYFFPGTGFYERGRLEGDPYVIQRGCDLRFVNLDPAAVANSHQIVSFRSRKGRPLFRSRRVAGPAAVRVRTRHLRPGTYAYYCPVHFGMFGRIRVVRRG